MTKKINLMIVGTPKSGTTSLLRNLAAHPEVTTHRQAEFWYFLGENTFSDGYEKAVDRFFGKEIRSVLVAKHVRLMYFEKAVTRLHEHNQNIQVVALLRHPVNRAYSAYWYARRQGWEELKTFEDAIAAEKENSTVGWNSSFPRDYLFNSLYRVPVERLLNVFGEKQTHIFLTEDLKTNSNILLESIFRFIDLQPIESEIKRYNEAGKARYERLAQLYSRIVHSPNNPIRRFFRSFFPKKQADYYKKAFVDWNRESFTPPIMDSQTRDSLLTYFQQENQLLGKLINRDLTIWDL